MRICISTILFQGDKYSPEITLDRGLEEIIPLLAGVGYREVEVWGRHLEGKRAGDIEKVAAIARKHGVAVGIVSPAFLSVATPEQFAEGVRMTLGMLDHAAVLGAEMVRITTGLSDPASGRRLSSAEASPAQYAAALTGIKEVLDKARGLGITVVAECHQNTFADGVESIRKLLSDVGDPGLKLIFQPTSFPGTDTADILGYIDALAPDIAHFHASNRRTDGTLAPIADGVYDYGAIVAKLGEAGYDGALSVEYMDHERAEEIAAREYRCLAGLIGT